MWHKHGQGTIPLHTLLPTPPARAPHTWDGSTKTYGHGERGREESQGKCWRVQEEQHTLGLWLWMASCTWRSTKRLFRPEICLLCGAYCNYWECTLPKCMIWIVMIGLSSQRRGFKAQMLPLHPCLGIARISGTWILCSLIRPFGDGKC